MSRARIRLAVPAVVLVAAGLSLAFSSGPPASYTNAPAFGGVPAENVCRLCHATNPLNIGGSITISGVPNIYLPDSTYDLTVTLASSQTAANAQRRWGFQITAARKDNGQGAGSFALVNATETQLTNGAGVYASRVYVEHKSAGLRQGQPSPVQWQLQWKAPPLAGGPPYTVYFYAAGNAANGDFSSGGDWIYATSDSTNVDTTPTETTTWGSVKARYRK